MGDAGTTGWRDENHRLWEEMAALHPDSPVYRVDEVVAGRDDLRPWEVDEVGPVDGLDLVHLQCHIGTDTVAWARRGARTVGVDFSGTALAAAGELSARCELDVEWVESDVYDAPETLGGRTFDVVYTGIGALVWLPDLVRWAQVVRRLLRPGGFVYVAELHPWWMAHWSDGRTMAQHAIDVPMVVWDEPERESYAVPDVRLEATRSHERLHTIADVITPLLAEGLVLELFHEQAATPAPTSWLEVGDDRLGRFPDGMYRFPLCFSLRARLPGGSA